MKNLSAIVLLLAATMTQAFAAQTNDIIEIDTQFCGSQNKPVGIRLNSYHALHYIPPYGNWLVATESMHTLPVSGFFYKQELPKSAFLDGTKPPISSGDKDKCLRYLSAHITWNNDMFAPDLYELMPELKMPTLRQYQSMPVPMLRKVRMIWPAPTLGSLIRNCEGVGRFEGFTLTNGSLPVQSVCSS